MKPLQVFDYINISPILGWIGTLSYLTAYLLLSIGKLRGDQKAYHILNLVGAIGLLYNAIYLKDFPNMVINIIWFAIGFTAMAVNKKNNN